MGVAVLVGQLSVGWSNDAVDAGDDARARRTAKPTVSGDVTVRALWVAAVVAVTTAVVLSWYVAGWIGGTFHVTALGLAWLYNVALSRTTWSWLPYALAFACVPSFLTFGLDGSPPPVWMTVVFAVVGTSAHLANALRDHDSDVATGLGGVAVRLGPERGERAAWILLAVGCAVLAVVAVRMSWALAALVVGGYGAARAYAARSGSDDALFRAILLAVAVDLVALLLAA